MQQYECISEIPTSVRITETHPEEQILSDFTHTKDWQS